MKYGNIVELFVKTKGYTLEQLEIMIYTHFNEDLIDYDVEESLYDERDLLED